MDGSEAAQAAERRFGPGPQDGAAAASQQTDPVAERLGIGPSEQLVSLEEIVGPQATVTFREKMQEVWGVLEVGSTSPLDVLAHMPLNLAGQNAMEILMVESPQGIHFVAFLRNSNDFEMLATFNRHALLPSNPSRQLIEAAMIAFQQVQTVAGDAAARLADKLKEIAESEDADYEKLGGVRAACLAAKRSKEGCARAMTHLVGVLDRLDKARSEPEGYRAEPPVPGSDESGELETWRGAEQEPGYEEHIKDEG